jgi:hypothetical protein
MEVVEEQALPTPAAAPAVAAAEVEGAREEEEGRKEEEREKPKECETEGGRPGHRKKQPSEGTAAVVSALLQVGKSAAGEEDELLGLGVAAAAGAGTASASPSPGR